MAGDSEATPPAEAADIALSPLSPASIDVVAEPADVEAVPESPIDKIRAELRKYTAEADWDNDGVMSPEEKMVALLHLLCTAAQHSRLAAACMRRGGRRRYTQDGLYRVNVDDIRAIVFDSRRGTVAKAPQPNADASAAGDAASPRVNVALAGGDQVGVVKSPGADSPVREIRFEEFESVLALKMEVLAEQLASNVNHQLPKDAILANLWDALSQRLRAMYFVAPEPSFASSLVRPFRMLLYPFTNGVETIQRSLKYAAVHDETRGSFVLQLTFATAIMLAYIPALLLIVTYHSQGIFDDKTASWIEFYAPLLFLLVASEHQGVILDTAVHDRWFYIAYQELETMEFIQFARGRNDVSEEVMHEQKVHPVNEYVGDWLYSLRKAATLQSYSYTSIFYLSSLAMAVVFVATPGVARVLMENESFVEHGGYTVIAALLSLLIGSKVFHYLWIVRKRYRDLRKILVLLAEIRSPRGIQMYANVWARFVNRVTRSFGRRGNVKRRLIPGYLPLDRFRNLQGWLRVREVLVDMAVNYPGKRVVMSCFVGTSLLTLVLLVRAVVQKQAIGIFEAHASVTVILFFIALGSAFYEMVTCNEVIVDKHQEALVWEMMRLDHEISADLGETFMGSSRQKPNADDEEPDASGGATDQSSDSGAVRRLSQHAVKTVKRDRVWQRLSAIKSRLQSALEALTRTPRIRIFGFAVTREFIFNLSAGASAAVLPFAFELLREYA